MRNGMISHNQLLLLAFYMQYTTYQMLNNTFVYCVIDHISMVQLLSFWGNTVEKLYTFLQYFTFS